MNDLVGYIIEHNFVHCEDADHLRSLAQQTFKGYSSTILRAAEEAMQRRFKETLLRGEDDEALFMDTLRKSLEALKSPSAGHSIS